MPDIKSMNLASIAALISRDWRNVYFGAKPYLLAMHCLNSVDDNYGLDDGRSIVSYFLCNASSWRGDVARAIKAELKSRIK
jgi:hypothetical protein